MKIGVLTNVIILFAFLLVTGNCNKATSSLDDIHESYDVIQDVTAISGGQNAGINLQRNVQNHAYYSLDFSNVESNKLITDSTREAWCIEWGIPAATGEQDNINLYSTNGREGWQELNSFLSKKEQLKKQDPDLTWKEIQVVIWSLVQFKPFHVDDMGTYSELDDGFYEDGEYQFNVQKVKDIVQNVKDEISSRNSNKWYFEVYAIIVENEGQTLIIEGYWNNNQIPFPF